MVAVTAFHQVDGVAGVSPFAVALPKIVLESEPLTDPVQVNGPPSGHLSLIANKKDFDFTLTLYELTPNGEYFRLLPYTSRASHVASLHQRRLLTPGRLTELDFSSRVRIVSRQVDPGSRLVLVVSIVKNPGQQINHGTGKDVSDESVAEAREPLTIQGLGKSYIEVPIRQEVPGFRGLLLRSLHYSTRSAAVGGTRTARRAGSQLARKAVAASSRIMAPKLSGSVGLMP